MSWVPVLCLNTAGDEKQKIQYFAYIQRKTEPLQKKNNGNISNP